MGGEARKVEVQCIVSARIEVDGMQAYAVRLELLQFLVLGHDDTDFVALANECAGDVDRVDTAARALEWKMIHK